MLKNLKGSPLSVFWHCETLARQGLALASPGALLGPIFLVCNFFKNFFFKKFRFSSTVKEYLTLGSLFAIIEPWIWRRLGPVPACWLTEQQCKNSKFNIVQTQTLEPNKGSIQSEIIRYADDTLMIEKLNTQSEDKILFQSWAKMNHLDCNYTKTELVVFEKRSVKHPNIVIGDHEI